MPTDAETQWPDMSAVLAVRVTDETLDEMTWRGSGWSAWVVRTVARELQIARDRLRQFDGTVA